MLGQREDRLRVDGHGRIRALEAVPREQLLIVLDDAVVDADDGSVADGVVVGLDRRVALRVVAHVDEHLVRVAGTCDRVEQLARAGALLHDPDARADPAERVPGRVGTAFGDPGEQRLRGERPLDARLGLRLYPAIPHMSHVIL